MGKTRDLFKKITDTKGTFYAKMGSIKDRDILGYRKSSLSPKGNILQKKKMLLVTCKICACNLSTFESLELGVNTSTIEHQNMQKY